LLKDLKNLKTSYCGAKVKFERLMCEVEFWEVFFEKRTRVFIVVPCPIHLLTAD